MKKKIIRLLIVMIVIIIFISTACFAVLTKLNKTKTVPLDATEEELNVSEETAKESKEKKIKNILLLGVDKDENASDAIMILSIDENNSSAKLSSIMRDTYVYFGKGKANKINYAYNYGGVRLSIAKINEIFNLDIQKYAKVDFTGFMNIVDALGGYSVDITEAERKEINYKLGYNSLTKSGNVVLNGEQTAAYARIRRIDNDYKRTERQRTIMFYILKKIKEQSITEYPSLISKLSSNVETNLTTMECLDLAKYLVKASNGGLKEFRVPMDGTATDNTKGVYHLDWNEEINIKGLHDFIYGD